MPRLCARHGGPASRTVKRSFHTPTPPWVLLLILVSLLIAAIVALAIRKSAHGYLPGCARCASDRRGFIAAACGGLTVGLLLTVLGFAVDSAGLLLLSLLVFLVALVGTFCGDQFRVRGRLRKDLQWVELRGVAPGFAAEMTRGLQQAQAAAVAHQHPAATFAPATQPAAAFAPAAQTYAAPAYAPTASPTHTPPAYVPPSGGDILPGR
jgi:hypothetical protein